MGFEHGLTFENSLETPTVDKLITYLKTKQLWPLLRAQNELHKQVLFFAYTDKSSLEWKEDFIIEVSEKGIYLLMHTGTGRQQNEIITWIQHCLRSISITGVLAEI